MKLIVQKLEYAKITVYSNFKIGKCEEIGINRKCECSDGWSGYDCKKRVCTKNESQLCGLHGKNTFIKGECKIIDEKSQCKCKDGYSGKTCKIYSCDILNSCGINGKFHFIFRNMYTEK